MIPVIMGNPSPGHDAPRQVEHTVIEAMSLALAHARRGSPARCEWLRQQQKFIKWLLAHDKQVHLWNQITRQLLREYQFELQGRSANTIRLAMQPLLQTANFMDREFGLPNPARGLGIGKALVKTPATVHLHDALVFCLFAIVANPRVGVGAVLQAFAGLRLQEALRLTWDRVNLEHGLIEVSGITKNPYSTRVIPIPNFALQCLRAVQGGTKTDGPVVQNPSGGSYAAAPQSYQNYSREVRYLIRNWNAKLDWAPKDLRKCVPTFLAGEGLLSDLSEQYLGHAPRSITQRNYLPRITCNSPGEQEALMKGMAVLRRLVVDPLNVAIEGSTEGKS